MSALTDRLDRQRLNLQRLDWQKTNGLLPAVVQHAITGRVLMLGFMNEESLEKTLSTRQATFFSRSRQCLWMKGETSGNTLEVTGIEIDCDNDTLLVLAEPAGPTCHTGQASCFDGKDESRGFGYLGELESVIRERSNNHPDESYTARLLGDGVRRLAQKVGEEGVELALAAAAGDSEEVVNEAADLVYHLLVLLHQQGLGLADVTAELSSRSSRASRGRTTSSG
jgi:phosphoribosyl-ATP pyrophosphohydrolase/phosphoribosyl-AMP cyclohydrolase